jgi:hypothetical protein
MNSCDKTKNFAHRKHVQTHLVIIGSMTCQINFTHVYSASYLASNEQLFLNHANGNLSLLEIHSKPH